MNPKNLAAFVNKGAAPASELDPMGGEEPGFDEEHNDEEEEEAAGTDMGALFSLTEQFADEIAEEATALPPDALANPEMELDELDTDALEQGFATMDRSFQAGFKKLAIGMSYDEALQVAEHLVEEDLIEDADSVAGWLYRVAQIA